jgi:hypothetical protein
MDTLTGKARGILLRLPHFFAPDTAGPLLLDVVDAAGRALERGETDLYGVLRAHHVQTADNEGAAGYTAPLAQRGDLDRILALYLEALGGTSQLVRVSPAFTARSLDVRRLAALLLEPDYPLRPYLQAALPAETWELLRRWDASNARVAEGEITEGLVMDLLLRRSPLAAYLAGRLDPRARALLDGYAGGDVSPELRAGLAAAFNARVLPDPQLYPRNAASWDALKLPEDVARLKNGIHGAFLRARAAAAGPDEARRTAEALEWAEVVPTPAGDDLVRLNRQLLEAASADARYPWTFAPRRIPAPTAPASAAETRPGLRDVLVDDFNRLLADPALARPENMAPETAEALPALRRRYAGRPEWLNHLLLEQAFPRAVEPGHAPYRDRLLQLIQVLRRGASTRRGIVDVVAANLGLVGDDPEARRARELIEVREYDPRQVTFFSGAVPFWGEVTIVSTNQLPTEAEFRLTMRAAPYAELTNVRLTNVPDVRRAEGAGDASVQWPGRMRAGDRLSLKGSTVLLNGVAPAEALARPVPPLPPGPSRWRFDADVVLAGTPAPGAWPVGRFDEDSGASAIFDRAVLAPQEPAVELEVLSQEYHPGTFTVIIPWNIPGFTDRYDATDHPRTQILGLVQRVKAAGVEGRVSYREAFTEDHAVDVALGMRVGSPDDAESGRFQPGTLLLHDQELVDAFSASSRQSGHEDQDTEDALVLSGVLDATRFDSLNTFA